ncbi:asparagine synthase-related protein [Sphingobium sp. Sx8-8]|uniref:asparagine synthase-related protein n=1 Tax=Sphingobium sp. Sx8-8 TaxID=2933617 RepID=UPI001F570542|nr:asparagine synthase-related protein [Sphingobium sp. Sx8-8]
MLTAAIFVKDLGFPITVEDRLVSFGESSIVGFPTDHLNFSIDDHGGAGWRICVSEEAIVPPLFSDTSDSFRQAVVGQGITIKWDPHRLGNAIEIERTACAGCAIYVAFSGGRLIMSWNFEEVARSLPQILPNKESCRIFIMEGEGQIREQVISGVFSLWPGELVRLEQGELRFREAIHLPVVQPASLADGAMVTEEFVRLLGEVMNLHLKRACNPILELSGGLDSSVVAIAASTTRHRMHSYAVVHAPPLGVQQANRRNEIISLLGLDDHTGSSYDVGPFSSLLTAKECTVTPCDDMYRLPCVRAFDRHPGGPFDVIFTGVGGDELVKDNSFLRMDWEVPGNIASSAIVTVAGRSDMFLRRGCWPVSPMANQRVVDFCRALPIKLKEKRQIHRFTLVRAGLSDGFIYPRYYEHYGHSFEQDLVRTDFDDAFGESVLGDYGVFDVNRLLVDAREAMVKGFPSDLRMQLYGALKLEVVMKNLMNRLDQ